MAKNSSPTTIEVVNAKRDQLFHAFSRESDRGLVMVSAAYLDEALESLLRARFAIKEKKAKSIVDPLFNTYGPLSTLSAKIKIAYSIDLIEKWVYQDLEILRKIRNKFAHGIGPAVFDSDEVIKLTEMFKGADHAVVAMEKYKSARQNSVEYQESAKEMEDGKTNIARKERLRTTMTATYIGGCLSVTLQNLESDYPLQAKLAISSGSE